MPQVRVMLCEDVVERAERGDAHHTKKALRVRDGQVQRKMSAQE